MMSNDDSEKIQENIFGIEDPDNWVCTVDSYISGHSYLVIRAYNENLDKAIKFGFEGIEYFSGAIRWEGANFRLHSQSDCVKLLLNHRPSYNEIITQLQEQNDMDTFKWKLYSILTSEGNLIQLIAINGGILILSHT